MSPLHPPLEPKALVLIRNFWPAVHQLEERTFRSEEERLVFVGLLRKINIDAHAALALAEADLEGVTTAPHSPVLVLMRSVAESAGQFSAWFLRGLSDERRDFEIHAAFLAGEISRLKHHLSTEGAKQHKAHVQSTVDRLTLEIQAHPEWSQVKTSDHGQILKGRWMPVSKADLVEKMGYGPESGPGLYSMLSDASHGGTRLLLQLAQPTPDAQRYMRSSLNYIAQSHALLLQDLADREPSVQTFIQEQPKLSAALSLYLQIARA